VAERVIVLIEDDWELQGNGLGDVAHLQYLPSLFLMRLCGELGMKATFMAETLQQLTMRRLGAEHRELRAQAALWEENVALMKERGHDVQLHLHPQWLGARYEDGVFRLGRNWNVATYDAETRRRIIRESVDYLAGLLRPLDAGYTVNAFKAGSWGLQPSEGILADLEAAGIRTVIGPGKGIVYVTDEFHADYAALEEDLYPYHPDYADVRRVGSGGIVVLPLPHFTTGKGTLLRKVARRVLGRGGDGGAGRFFYLPPLPPEASAPTPMLSGPRQGGLKGAAAAALGIRSLDVSSAPFAETGPALDQIMERCLRAEADAVPLVIQSHTKGYEGHWDDVAAFFRHLVERYGRHLEFRTLSELQSLLPALRVKGRAADA
jgi:hypothetical protein